MLSAHAGKRDPLKACQALVNRAAQAKDACEEARFAERTCKVAQIQINGPGDDQPRASSSQRL